MGIDYVIILGFAILGFYLVAPASVPTFSLIVSVSSAFCCVVAVVLIWRMFRDK